MDCACVCAQGHCTRVLGIKEPPMRQMHDEVTEEDLERHVRGIFYIGSREDAEKRQRDTREYVQNRHVQDDTQETVARFRGASKPNSICNGRPGERPTTENYARQKSAKSTMGMGYGDEDNDEVSMNPLVAK